MPIFVRLCLVLILASPMLRAETPPDNPTTLTEQQAIGLFYQNNLGLIAAQYQLDQAHAEEIIASAIPNPVFSLSISELSSHLSDAQPQDRNSLPAVYPQIQQLIETAGKRSLRMESAGLGAEAAELDVQDLVRQLTNAVRHAYYNLLLAQKNHELAEDTVKRYQQILGANAVRLRAGDISESDYTRIEVESLKAQGDLDRAQTALKLAKADLLLLLGWPENRTNPIAADAWPAANLKEISTQEDHLTHRALETRPDLKAARIRILQAERNLDLARRLAIPDVTLEAGYGRDPGNYFTNTGNVGFSVPLPIFYRQEGEISKAGVSLNSAQLQVRQSEQSIRTEVVKALSAWRSAEEIARRFETSVLARIAKLREAQEFAYQKGATGLLDLIDAERNYKAMLSDYHSALANRSNAWADLLMALGEEAKK